jgi:hypothetical protein
MNSSDSMVIDCETTETRVHAWLDSVDAVAGSFASQTAKRQKVVDTTPDL